MSASFARYAAFLRNNEPAYVVSRNNVPSGQRDEFFTTDRGFAVVSIQISKTDSTLLFLTGDVNYDSPTGLCTAIFRRNGTTNNWDGPSHIFVKRDGVWVTLSYVRKHNIAVAVEEAAEDAAEEATDYTIRNYVRPITKESVRATYIIPLRLRPEFIKSETVPTVPLFPIHRDFLWKFIHTKVEDPSHVAQMEAEWHAADAEIEIPAQRNTGKQIPFARKMIAGDLRGEFIGSKTGLAINFWHIPEGVANISRPRIYCIWQLSEEVASATAAAAAAEEATEEATDDTITALQTRLADTEAALKAAEGRQIAVAAAAILAGQKLKEQEAINTKLMERLATLEKILL